MNRAAVEALLASIPAISQSQALELMRLMDESHVVNVDAAATITVDAEGGDVFVLAAPSGNFTIAAPLNPRVGKVIGFVVQQGGTARTITWNAAFKKAADPTPTANRKAFTQFVYDGTHWVQMPGAFTYFA